MNIFVKFFSLSLFLFRNIENIIRFNEKNEDKKKLEKKKITYSTNILIQHEYLLQIISI